MFWWGIISVPYKKKQNNGPYVQFSISSKMKRSTHQFPSARSWSTLRSRFYTSDGDDSSWSRRSLVISHTVDYTVFLEERLKKNARRF
ncbi:hypothetical protein EVAR_89093_1 [Eumeta japonica]|uniref:Uncharacterized protein n=1 Tax=Eumeta variegata TaxID=151549 RepID=A0A4C1XEW6_EUMVA|nr:hypothetical protein EVAR_89093_1 [Eumeta japonica]